MKIGLIGSTKLKFEKLKSIYQFEDIDPNQIQDKIENYSAVICSPDSYNMVPLLNIPKSCLFYNTFDAGSGQISKFKNLKGKKDQTNFLLQYPSMESKYFENALYDSIRGLPFQPLKLEKPGVYFDIAILKRISSKRQWLIHFQEELKKRVYIDNETFFQSVSTIVDELILNAFIHGYGVNLEDVHNIQTGKVLIRWGLDESNLVLKISDFAGRFDTLGFLEKHRLTRSADDISAEKTGGLGLLMAVNYADHIEIATIEGKKTIVKVYIDLNRVLFSRRGRPKRSTMIIKNTPSNEDFD